jgi:hypothetical protein
LRLPGALVTTFAPQAETIGPPTSPRWTPGVRARLLLAFVGISGFAILAAAAGIYAFRQVGDRIEAIDARVPRVVSSQELSRATERLIATAPALLAAATTAERDEVSNGMRPEVDRLIVALNEILRAGAAGETAATIESLVDAPAIRS